MKKWPVGVAGLPLDWPGPVLADVLEVLSHKTFGGALVMVHDCGEQRSVLTG
jgi:hypothetical protein